MKAMAIYPLFHKGMIGFYGSPIEGKEGIVGKTAKELVKELKGKSSTSKMLTFTTAFIVKLSETILKDYLN